MVQFFSGSMSEISKLKSQLPCDVNRMSSPGYMFPVSGRFIHAVCRYAEMSMQM